MNNSDVINQYLIYIEDLRSQLGAVQKKTNDAWTEAESARVTIRKLENCIVERDARIAELEAAQAWVSVDERLPEVGASVATKSRTGAYGVIMDVRNSGEWFYAVFSHWMPLPQPPTTAEKEENK